jgi:hypothetical protein
MANCLIGTAQISCAIPACPLVTAGSLIAGIGFTACACLKCNCTDDAFFKERDQICKCFGLVQGTLVTTNMCSSGFDNIKYTCSRSPEPIVQSNMTRN